ncbi:MAG: DUF1501 domain-containing protein [Planctomycetes bacterium]|nr:DUF1501 domain-containing protein [Planctomycetota bacterium]MCW8136282.1 DUF1501 domain-containing protein [Planctomycetota bacterium]
MTEFRVNRRDFLRTGAYAGGLMVTTSFLGSTLAAQETARKRNSKINHVILLYMEGGPSQLETFDPKPGTKNGGPTKALKTEVPGFTPADSLPYIAKRAKDLLLIKSMSTREGNHSRGAYLMRTGYAPNPTIKHPSLGSIVAQQLGNPDFELPNFVKLRGAPFPAGYLGVDNNPFVINRPGARIENLDYAKGVDKDRMERRMKLVREMEKDFAKERGEDAVEAHRAMYEKARRLMDSPLRKKFYLDDEPGETRKAYGEGQFADSLIIARRLIEVGVPAIEVVMGGWDTHDDNFKRSADLCKQIDQPWAALIDDLKKRKLYDSTLVIWMGEFGRTPRISGTSGRDHWPNNFCVVLGGGGVNAGTVIGETDEEGAGRDGRGNPLVKDPVSPAELYKTLGVMMDWEMNKEFQAGNRPMWLTEKTAKPVEKIFK